MKKRIIVFFGIILTIVVLLAGTVAVFNTYYYKDTFAFGTWINGIYCTGMTAQEAAAQLLKVYDTGNISVILMDDTKEIPLARAGVIPEYLPKVQELLACNSGWHYWQEAGLFRTYEIVPDFSYDREQMETYLQETAWLNRDLYDKDNTVTIEKTEDTGYVLIDKTKGLLLKKEAIQVIEDAILNQKESVSLPENNCYTDIPYTEEMLATLETWKAIEEFQDFQLVYQFKASKEVVDAGVVSDWMTLNSDGDVVFDKTGKPVLDKTMVKEYVAYLAASYNTVGITREFRTTRGDIVTIEEGSYGTELDCDEEYKYLLEAFQNKMSGVRTPVYLSEAKETGTDDIGDTYVEIDMGNQILYYYKDKKLVLATPVVTGNTSRNMGTPSKVCYVYFKQRNRVLRGADYATPVKYWMAVDGRIGIHDASWRKEFGGEIYKTDGSHGCINTPTENMEELYDIVEIGTPVIMYY